MRSIITSMDHRLLDIGYYDLTGRFRKIPAISNVFFTHLDIFFEAETPLAFSRWSHSISPFSYCLLRPQVPNTFYLATSKFQALLSLPQGFIVLHTLFLLFATDSSPIRFKHICDTAPGLDSTVVVFNDYPLFPTFLFPDADVSLLQHASPQNSFSFINFLALESHFSRGRSDWLCLSLSVYRGIDLTWCLMDWWLWTRKIFATAGGVFTQHLTESKRYSLATDNADGIYRKLIGA